MEENLYDAPTQTAPDDASMPPDDMKDGEDSGQTVLANKELCPDCRPGDKLIVEVVKDHGKEVSLKYVSKYESEGSDMPADSGEMDEIPQQDDSMMS